MKFTQWPDWIIGKNKEKRTPEQIAVIKSQRNYRKSMKKLVKTTARSKRAWRGEKYY